MWYQQW